MVRSWPSGSKNAVTPTTAFSFNSGGSRWIVEIDFVCLDLSSKIGRHRLGINFQAECERLLGADALANAAKFFAGDGFMQPELAAPEIFRAERVEAKNLLALFEHSRRVLLNLAIVTTVRRDRAGGRSCGCPCRTEAVTTATKHTRMDDHNKRPFIKLSSSVAVSVPEVLRVKLPTEAHHTLPVPAIG